MSSPTSLNIRRFGTEDGTTCHRPTKGTEDRGEGDVQHGCTESRNHLYRAHPPRRRDLL